MRNQRHGGHQYLAVPVFLEIERKPGEVAYPEVGSFDLVMKRQGFGRGKKLVSGAFEELNADLRLKKLKVFADRRLRDIHTLCRSCHGACVHNCLEDLDLTDV